MNINTQTCTPDKERSIAALCTGAFLMSIGGGIYLVALPFMLKRLGGTDADVGIGIAVNFGSYMIACLAFARHIDRYNAKRLVQWGTVGILLSYGGAMITVLFAQPGISGIWILNAFSTLLGFATAIFWPPMMGWISRGYEGQKLSHRLGSFNMSWSSGSWVSPYLGGLLVGISSTWPMAAATLVATACFVAIKFAANPARDRNLMASDTKDALQDHEFHPNLAGFQWMARVALIAAFVCIGLFRSQVALLFKFELGYSEAMYGIAITIMCAANFAGFTLAGRAHKWHYVGWLFWAVQLVIAAAMLLVIFYPRLYILFVAFALLGGCEAFVYVSHLFYGVSGGKNRSGLMAIHE
jgi:MFS family permease